MINSLKSTRTLIHQVITLAKPYGVRKLVLVIVFAIAQGAFQVIGVTSIFPFLALAANPDSLIDSPAARFLPDWSSDKQLIAAGTLSIGMLFLANLANLVAEFYRANYARRFCSWMRVELLTEMVSRPYPAFLETNTAVLLKKVSGDVLQYTYDVLLPLLDSFAKLVTVVFLFVTFLVIHPTVTIIATVTFGSFYLLIFGILRKLRSRTSDGLKTASKGIMREAQQLLSGIKAIKVQRVEQHFLDEFRSHSITQAFHLKWKPLYQNGPKYFMEPIALGSVVGIVLFLTVRGESFSSILPSLGMLSLASYRLLPALQALYSQVSLITTQRHSLEEVYSEFIELEKAIDKQQDKQTTPFPTPEPLEWSQSILLDSISFQYPNSRQTSIGNLTFSIRKNSSVGILGPSGSGKSTLVDLILGLQLPSSGRILVDDKELKPDMIRAWQGGIGYVPQEIFLIDNTIRANIAFGLPDNKISETRLKEAAEMAQLSSFIEQELENAWDTNIGERGVRLSGGQRQRIGLARALYHSPSLLILDEATSALDVETESEVMKAISKLRGKITMVIVAHRLGTIENCDVKLDLANYR